MSSHMSSPQLSVTRVVRDPHVQGGEPVVKGTRVTVASVMLAEREWGGVDGVLYAYPHLTAEQVADARVLPGAPGRDRSVHPANTLMTPSPRSDRPRIYRMRTLT